MGISLYDRNNKRDVLCNMNLRQQYKYWNSWLVDSPSVRMNLSLIQLLLYRGRGMQMNWSQKIKGLGEDDLQQLF